MGEVSGSSSGRDRSHHAAKADAAGADIRKFLVAISAANLGLVYFVISDLRKCEAEMPYFMVLSVLSAILALAFVGISWFIQKHKHLKLAKANESAYELLDKKYRRYLWSSFTWDRLSAVFILSSAFFISASLFQNEFWSGCPWVSYALGYSPILILIIHDIFNGSNSEANSN